MAANEQHGTAQTKEKFYKARWFWAVVVLLLIGIVVPKGADRQPSVTSQPASNVTTAEAATSQPKAEEPQVPAEYRSALVKATSYANYQHMSKMGVYDLER